MASSGSVVRGFEVVLRNGNGHFADLDFRNLELRACVNGHRYYVEYDVGTRLAVRVDGRALLTTDDLRYDAGSEFAALIYGCSFCGALDQRSYERWARGK